MSHTIEANAVPLGHHTGLKIEQKIVLLKCCTSPSGMEEVTILCSSCLCFLSISNENKLHNHRQSLGVCVKQKKVRRLVMGL